MFPLPSPSSRKSKKGQNLAFYFPLSTHVCPVNKQHSTVAMSKTNINCDQMFVMLFSARNILVLSFEVENILSYRTFGLTFTRFSMQQKICLEEICSKEGLPSLFFFYSRDLQCGKFSNHENGIFLNAKPNAFESV